MRKLLILVTLTLAALSGSAQIKKITSEDLITGKIEKWIEVTDSVTLKVKRFDYPKEKPILGALFSPNKGLFDNYITPATVTPLPFVVDTSIIFNHQQYLNR